MPLHTKIFPHLFCSRHDPDPRLQHKWMAQWWAKWKTQIPRSSVHYESESNLGYTHLGEREITQFPKALRIGQWQQKKGLMTRARRHASTPQQQNVWHSVQAIQKWIHTLNKYSGSEVESIGHLRWVEALPSIYFMWKGAALLPLLAPACNMATFNRIH